MLLLRDQTRSFLMAHMQVTWILSPYVLCTLACIIATVVVSIMHHSLYSYVPYHIRIFAHMLIGSLHSLYTYG